MTEEELARLEALAVLAGPLRVCDAEGIVAVADGWLILLRGTYTHEEHDRRFIARACAAADLAAAASALVAEVRRQSVSLALAELARTEAEARTALDALHARVDAAERAAETARAEEREACARIARDLAEQERAMVAWLREQGLPTADARARYDAADLIERQIRARGGDRG